MASFASYSAIIAGLSNTGVATRFETFLYNSELYMVVSKSNASITAYKWNGSAWETTSLFTAFDTNPGNAVYPAVFEHESNLYLICGMGSTAFNGYIWSVANSRWETNTAIKSGLTASAAYNQPTFFKINTDFYCVYGKSDGLFSGFKWNGSAWVSDSGIISGLTDVGVNARPDYFNYGSDHYLIHGGSYAWKWNGSAWAASTIASATNSAPGGSSSFKIGDYYYSIFVTTSGTFIGYRLQPTAKITSVTAEPGINLKAKLTVNLSEPIESGDVLTAYNAPSAAGLGNALYLVELTQKDSLTWEYQTNISETELCYFRGVETFAGTQIDTADYSNKRFFVVPTMADSVINITDANNYRILSNPAHNWNHGLLFRDSFVFGAARNSPDLGAADVFKIEAANYSNLLQKTIYLNKTGSLNRLSLYDQIVVCAGFLWCHSGQYLVRINLSDLDYMIFSGLPSAAHSEPLAADNNYIYITAGLAATKIDASLLIGSFASYGYDGTAAVAIPPAAILATCNFIQHHPTEIVYCHSAIVDNQYLYCAQTTPASTASGYDSGLSLNMCHLQKIRKSDMVSVGDVVIPRSTDDMVHNSEYLFLAPELPGIGSNSLQLGFKWGLFAVNKQSLQIKYLKSLIPQQYNNGSYNATYGVFYFSDKITVQQSTNSRTVVINIDNVESWGDNFPIAGATDAIFKFQLNGVDLTACNELVLDNAGFVHTNTWQTNTMIFKFNLSQITTAVKTPNIATTLISSNANSATFGGFIIDEGNSPITSGGFKWGTDPEALTNDLPADPFSYDFQELLSGLSAGVYYFKAYGTNTEGTFYGNTVMFSIAAQYNAVSLHNDDTIALLEFIDTHFGCSIRCVQDAPGVATGTTGTVQDQDGNVYDTVVINEKRYMVQNLKTTHFRNGDPVPNITDAAAWQSDEIGAQCAYNNKPANV